MAEYFGHAHSVPLFLDVVKKRAPDDTDGAANFQRADLAAAHRMAVMAVQVVARCGLTHEGRGQGAERRRQAVIGRAGMWVANGEARRGGPSDRLESAVMSSCPSLAYH
jgi:hypothetical protein